MQHNYGTMQLIRHRGPDRFTTDFEKSLLVSQAMNIVSFPETEAISPTYHMLMLFAARR